MTDTTDQKDFYTVYPKAIFTIRTFAIYGKNWLILVLLSVLGVAIVAVTIVSHSMLNKCGVYVCESLIGSASFDHWSHSINSIRC